MKRTKIFCLLFVVLSAMTVCSCSTLRKTQVQYVEVPKIEKEYIAKTDTTIIRDSIYINRYQKADTVYLDSYKYKYITRIKTDTLQVKDTLTVVKEVQVPQKYIPSYYKTINRWFWMMITLILLFLGYRAYKIIKKV